MGSVPVFAATVKALSQGRGGYELTPRVLEPGTSYVPSRS